MLAAATLTPTSLIEGGEAEAAERKRLARPPRLSRPVPTRRRLAMCNASRRKTVTARPISSLSVMSRWLKRRILTPPVLTASSMPRCPLSVPFSIVLCPSRLRSEASSRSVSLTKSWLVRRRASVASRADCADARAVKPPPAGPRSALSEAKRLARSAASMCERWARTLAASSRSDAISELPSSRWRHTHERTNSSSSGRSCTAASCSSASTRSASRRSEARMALLEASKPDGVSWCVLLASASRCRSFRTLTSSSTSA